MFGFYVVLACVCRVAPLLNAARLSDENEPVPNDSGELDILEDGYNRTYCVVPDISNVSGYILGCFKHTLLTYGFSLTTLVSEATAKKPQMVEAKNELTTYAVDWKVPGRHLEASALNEIWFPFNQFCGQMFVRLTTTEPNLDDFPPTKYVYIALGENDGFIMNETQKTNIFRGWLSEYFNLNVYPENYKVNSVTPATLNGRKVHVVEFRDLAMKVTQEIVANKGYYDDEPSAANFHRVGVVSESAWLLTEPALGCPHKIAHGREKQMGYWHLSAHLAQGQEAWTLFTCELRTPDCTNKHRAVVKVVGKGIQTGATYVNIPIPYTFSSLAQWECTFWWLPNRWADETTTGTEKICTVQNLTTNSPGKLNFCKKTYMWQIGNTDFYAQGYFRPGPMRGPMLLL